ncbi:diguanylate cyclase [Vibrio orientalis CIP 102891 = ATCC 33934]|uniref:diguanylate cyclase n=1 Tax=Vibrio orientalis CIP 102891 = ATCC 33934 TaxID=675816 RepID=C9QDN5_VIBOR|nr:diguanylate cyclase [Vibrio orientalis]EEX93937.1 hypothetical protein VIA_001095 [Vibrio orientalis CIP 102891 = ATCC 33934]EGU48388.1 diguanylate cyclase [Vibrio orientalis CIP 102891 = ATCC 33934]
MASINRLGYKQIAISPLASLVSRLLVVSGGVVIACTFYFLSVIDKQAEEDVLKRVELAIALERKHREHIVSEYTYWDEAYTKIVVEKDTDWIDTNTGKYLAEAYEYDFTIGVVDHEKKAFYFIADDTVLLTFDQIYSSSLRYLKELSSRSEEETKTASSFFMLGGELYLVTGGPLINEELATPRPGTYIAAGKRIDSEYLQVFAENYYLPTLTQVQSTASVDSQRSLRLQNATGATISIIEWEQGHPSHEILPILLLLILVVLGISAFIVQRIIVNDCAARNAYEQKLYLEATTDPLTKLSNRRHFFEIGEQLVQNEMEPLAVVIIDIDHFKKINDNYGHQVGDLALSRFAEMCCREIRASDIIGRIGGEEFAIILLNVDLAIVNEVTERIRKRVAESNFNSEVSSLSMTISLGVALSDQAHTLEHLIKRADGALYQAKVSGRNRVVISEQVKEESC